MIDRLKELIGKKVFLQISGNRQYNGTIKHISNDLIEMSDKYGDIIFISISEIKFLQEKND